MINKLKKLKKYYKYYGMEMLLLKLLRKHSVQDDGYEQWMKQNDITETELKEQRAVIFDENPKISVIVPTYETTEQFLREMIESVKSQTYSNWELCIADGSDSQNVMEILEEYIQEDNRIIVKHLKKNKGIADNTNEAIALANGEYIAFLDHDDVLAPDALYEVVKTINMKKNVDIIYSDEDKLRGDSSKRFEPHFKPDFNIELLRSNNYICHLFVVKKQIVESVCGIRAEFNGAQDYDLILRCVEKSSEIYHIAKILYHWRVHENSTSGHPESKAYAYSAGQKAIEEHLQRVNRPGKVKQLYYPGFYHVKYDINTCDGLTIIVLRGKDKRAAQSCIRTIRRTIGLDKYEIMIVQNLEQLQKKQINYKYVLFVNASVHMISKNWGIELIGICQYPENGAVGIQLLDKKTKTIYHNGIKDSSKDYVFQGKKIEEPGAFHRDEIMQCVDGVTTSFLLMQKDTFLECIGKDVIKNERELGKYLRQHEKQSVLDPHIKAWYIKSN